MEPLKFADRTPRQKVHALVAANRNGVLAAANLAIPGDAGAYAWQVCNNFRAIMKETEFFEGLSIDNPAASYLDDNFVPRGLIGRELRPGSRAGHSLVRFYRPTDIALISVIASGLTLLSESSLSKTHHQFFGAGNTPGETPFASAAVEVLRLLAAHPEKKYTQAEACDKINYKNPQSDGQFLSPSRAYNVLTHLDMVGAIHYESIGYGTGLIPFKEFYARDIQKDIPKPPTDRELYRVLREIILTLPPGQTITQPLLYQRLPERFARLNRAGTKARIRVQLAYLDSEGVVMEDKDAQIQDPPSQLWIEPLGLKLATEYLEPLVLLVARDKQVQARLYAEVEEAVLPDPRLYARYSAKLYLPYSRSYHNGFKVSQQELIQELCIEYSRYFGNGNGYVPVTLYDLGLGCADRGKPMHRTTILKHAQALAQGPEAVLEVFMEDGIYKVLPRLRE